MAKVRVSFRANRKILFRVKFTFYKSYLSGCYICIQTNLSFDLFKFARNFDVNDIEHYFSIE